MPYRAASRLVSRLSRRFGRRSAALVLVGLIWLAYGVAGLATGATIQPDLWLDPHPFVMPVGWIVSGGTSIVVGVLRRGERVDALGFTSLSIMPMFYTAAFLVGWLGAVLPLATPEPWYYPLGFAWAVVWGAVVGLVALLASWPDVPDSVEEMTAAHPDDVLGGDDA